MKPDYNRSKTVLESLEWTKLQNSLVLAHIKIFNITYKSFNAY